MGIKIFHINIRSFKNNKYALMIELSNFSPDVVLLNETGNKPNFHIKLQGYNCIEKSSGLFSGVAILIKNTLSYEFVFTSDSNVLAIKLNTHLGPILISTAYSPPRDISIPTPSLSKIFSYQIPTIFIGDLNGHHPLFDNTSLFSSGDSKGKQIFNLINQFSLRYIGPDFKTYVTKKNRGKPDIILINKLFDIFNYHSAPGDNIGSDHIPILFTFQIQPIKVIKPPTIAINSLNISQFKEELRTHPFRELDGKPVQDIDSEINSLMSAITSSTKNNSKTSSIHFINQYIPTYEIQYRLAEYQENCMNYYRFNSPTLKNLHSELQNIISLTKSHLSNNWQSIVQLAVDNYGNPRKFWQSIKNLQGNSSPHPLYLVENTFHDDSESDNFDTFTTAHITDPLNQAKLMSKSWAKIFTPNSDQQFDNPHTRDIKAWYENIKPSLQPHLIIDKSNLIADHPLWRPITTTEILNCFTSTPNKAPGLSKISFFQLKNLPSNCIRIVENIYNSIISAKHIPSILENIKMIFLQKPFKHNSDPLNYRPICLIETLYKGLEKILAKRLSYFLEHHNLLTEKQFGFRPNRSTQHAINLLQDVILNNSSQGYISLIATRDIQKAFDTMWFPGLLYKLHAFPGVNVDFLAFIYQFLHCRKLIPFFQNTAGPIIVPTAGVPQGSSLGPVLYSIYVNDHPQPVYKSTIVSQFADDLIHIVKSDSKNKLKHRSAIKKMNSELKQTQLWENKWGIKCNPQKCTLAVTGTQPELINRHGQVKINNIHIPIKRSVKILGYHLANSVHSCLHINNTITKAKINLSKLKRFSSAPTNIKKHLYKALIRPILEYPCYPLSLTNITNKRKLQSVQNKALRFILDIQLKDRVKTQLIHDKLKIDPLNIHTHKLAAKCVNQIRNNYLCTSNNTSTIPYKFSDYVINFPPSRKKRRTLALRIKKYVYKPIQSKKLKNYKPLLLKNNIPDKWISPLPIFKA